MRRRERASEKAALEQKLKCDALQFVPGFLLAVVETSTLTHLCRRDAEARQAKEEMRRQRGAEAHKLWAQDKSAQSKAEARRASAHRRRAAAEQAKAKEHLASRSAANFQEWLRNMRDKRDILMADRTSLHTLLTLARVRLTRVEAPRMLTANELFLIATTNAVKAGRPTEQDLKKAAGRGGDAGKKDRARWEAQVRRRPRHRRFTQQVPWRGPLDEEESRREKMMSGKRTAARKPASVGRALRQECFQAPGTQRRQPPRFSAWDPSPPLLWRDRQVASALGRTTR